eukprot:TRINITY_DN24536_c0_g1_i1.p1 TRINITY_DN24536_c0_g1~~TRINITY_DN24536_c0_g1_i1.p1  ORF type:complete len:283 (-),score=35.33 TRINITY_DN24536_c0_g1_i1:122-970(-)
MSLRFDWPEAAALESELEKRLKTVLSGIKDLPDPLAGPLELRSLNLGTVPPEIAIIGIHELNRHCFKFDAAIQYEGDLSVTVALRVRLMNPTREVTGGTRTPAYYPLELTLQQVRLSGQLRVEVQFPTPPLPNPTPPPQLHTPPQTPPHNFSHSRLHATPPRQILPRGYRGREAGTPMGAAFAILAQNEEKFAHKHSQNRATTASIVKPQSTPKKDNQAPPTNDKTTLKLQLLDDPIKDFTVDTNFEKAAIGGVNDIVKTNVKAALAPELSKCTMKEFTFAL